MDEQFAEGSFLGLPDLGGDADILISPVPYELTTSYGQGTARGPAACIEASGQVELFDELLGEELPAGAVIRTVEPWDGEGDTLQEQLNGIGKYASKQYSNGGFPIFLGGEHGILPGILRGCPEKVSLIQIDAHADLRPSYAGTIYNHACAVYDASKNCNLVQVGIRSMDISEKEHMDYNKVFFADEIRYGGSWADQAMEVITDNVYITFDLDAFDPSIMPATGTPEPGGLHWYLVSNFLQRVFEERNVVGFDIVELAPIEGHKASQFLAAKLYYKMLSYKFV